MKQNILLFLVTIPIILFILYYFKNINEGFNTFEEQQEEYYKARENNNLPSISKADTFLKFDNTNNSLELQKPDTTTSSDGSYAPVDDAVVSCKHITSCDQLDGTQCGYCFYNDKFSFGDKDGPKTDVCPGGWVKTKEDCIKKRQRNICEKVNNCHEMIGEASICAWCPTKNKAFVYKNENNKILPKYTDDICDDADINGANLGLVLAKDCDKFANDHPCIGSNETTGPHSDKCLNKLWESVGCSSKGTSAPLNNDTAKSYWNNRGWKDVFNDMELWHQYAVGSNWELAKSHTKGCLGTDPNPCDPKFGGTIECYQDKFVALGCKKEGSAYPTIKPSINMNDYDISIKKLIQDSNNNSLSYKEKNDAFNKCYGGNLKPPPPIKIGDRVKMSINIGGNNDAVCADTNDNSIMEFEGYVCKQDGTLNSILWDKMTNNKPAARCGNKPVSWSKTETNNIEWISKYLGFCGVNPEYYNKTVSSKVESSVLQLVHSCDKANNTCATSGCSMQTITYVNYPNNKYSVSKDDVTKVLSIIRGVYPGVKLADKSDIQYLVDTGIPYCSCGWVNISGKLTTVYPSINGTDGSCGGGKQSVISCGDNGPSWANGKAGVYVIINSDPDTIPTKLSSVKLSGSVVSVVGKDDYNSII